MANPRGRPTSKKYEKDLGTPELQEKRKYYLTLEPLDICLNKGLVTEEQYGAGNKLRWLYTLIFGSPHINAYDPADLGDKFLSKYKDGKWLMSRQQEYKAYIEQLRTLKAEQIVMNTCIYCLQPSFLSLGYYSPKSINDLVKFRDGLDNIYKSK